MAVYRVYFHEYTTVYTSQAEGAAGLAECVKWFDEKYDARQLQPLYRTVPVREDDPLNGPMALQVLRWNRRGEFRDPADAQALEAELGDGAVTVPRWSQQEDKLLSSRGNRG